VRLRVPDTVHAILLRDFVTDIQSTITYISAYVHKHKHAYNSPPKQGICWFYEAAILAVWHLLQKTMSPWTQSSHTIGELRLLFHDRQFHKVIQGRRLAGSKNSFTDIVNRLKSLRFEVLYSRSAEGINFKNYGPVCRRPTRYTACILTSKRCPHWNHYDCIAPTPLTSLDVSWHRFFHSLQITVKSFDSHVCRLWASAVCCTAQCKQTY